MDTSFDPTAAASLLAELHRGGAQTDALPESLRPHTLAEGYDVQDRLLALLDATPVGWKLGVGSPSAKVQSGIGRPVAGRVLRERCFPLGATVLVPSAGAVTVELEIAYVIGRDILPTDPPPADLAAVIGEVRATVELVRARFVDRRAVGWPSFAADNAGFEALIVGETIDPARLPEMPGTARVLLDGVEQATALTGDDATDPQGAFRDLLALARERNLIVPAGAIVSTGTVTRPFDVAGGAAVEARYLDAVLAFNLQPIAPTGNAP